MNTFEPYVIGALVNLGDFSKMMRWNRRPADPDPTLSPEKNNGSNSRPGFEQKNNKVT